MPLPHLDKQLPWLVLALGLLATWFLQGAAMDAARRNQQDSFVYETSEIKLRVVQRLSAYEGILHGLQGLYAASKRVERNEFHEYVKKLHIADYYPGVQGLGYALIIPAQKKAGHVDALRAEGFPGYTLHPQGKRDLYTSVIYLEPFAGLNLRAFGYDMYAEAVRRAAMDRARDTGELAMSGKVHLMVETGQDVQAGFLMYLPVYRNGSLHETPSERRANLSGWVYAIFRSGDLLHGTLGDQIENIGFEVFDGDSAAPSVQMYDSDSSPGHTYFSSLYKSTQRIEFGGRAWMIRLHSLPVFENKLNVKEANLIRLTGALGSALLALLVWQLVGGRARALGVAEFMENELRESERHFRTVTESANDAIITSNSAGSILNWNAAAQLMFGHTLNGVMGQSLTVLMPERFHNRLNKVLTQMGAGNAARLTRGKILEIVGLHKNGSEFPVEISIAQWDVGEKRFFSAIVRNISARKMAEEALRDSHKDLDRLLNSMVECAYGIDVNGSCTFVNQSFLEKMGYQSEDEVLGKNMHALIHHSRADGSHYPVSECEIYRAFQANHAANVDDDVFWRKDGSAILVEYWSNPVVRDGVVTGSIVTFIEITDRKNSEEAIHRLAFFDPLTQLPNRRLLLDRLHQATAVSTRSGRHGAVLFLDLDHFKIINDTQGHAMGDLLLIEVAHRLQSCVREGDSVARLGGDEFVVVLEDLSVKQDEAVTQAKLVAEKIHEQLNRLYRLNDYECHISSSIGICLFLDHLEDAGELLRQADVAMYQAKKAGRNAIRFFDPQMQAVLEKRVALEADLRQALASQQFRLHYQVQVDSLGKAIGAEALLRWEHPERGLVYPDQFIQLAEETGLIVPIGLWALQTACAQLKSWENDALTRELTLAVNVSARQFRQADFVAQVKQALLDSGVRPSHLKLELTESAAMENVEESIAEMREIKLLGICFSMDDFGTGYSSLQYLKRLPLDQVKIDRAFVSDITGDPDDAAIVLAIIAMAKALKLYVIAEGVETEVQRNFLDKHGCHAFQGYLYSKPVAVEKFEALLKQS